VIILDYMTAEQAAEAAKGLTFEKVWAALMESRQRMDESQQDWQKKLDESRQDWQKKLDESRQQMKESNAEAQARMDKMLGGLGNSLGRLTEAMFTPDLWKKFADRGLPFNSQCYRKKITDGKHVIAELDVLIENGEYSMPVEIKTVLSVEDVDEHLERIGKVRQVMDAHGGKRKLIGAVAGGSVPENVLRYAQRKGLFVIVQTSDSIDVADMPETFKARDW
jgi:hypothetical protein